MLTMASAAYDIKCSALARGKKPYLALGVWVQVGVMVGVMVGVRVGVLDKLGEN